MGVRECMETEYYVDFQRFQFVDASYLCLAIFQI